MFPRIIVENIMPLIRFNPATGLFLALNNNPIYSIMLRKFNISTVFLAFALWLTACVPARQFEDLKKKQDTCETQNAKLKLDNADLTTRNTELKADIDRMNHDISTLVRDSTDLGTAYRRLNNIHNDLMISYDKLLSNNEKLLSGNSEETKKLITELGTLNTALLAKEAALKEREEKLAELQGVLAKKDSATKSLKDAVTKALLGFQNNGLTIETKNGKVYVSMEERLLFASGSTNVEKGGEDALKQLAQVLEKNKDINVLVEGHTDDVPISGTLPSGAKDNWELSVLRATSVTKIILKGSSIEASRITAAGRGPYFPLDPSKTVEARKKNRRTEIILSPKLDELLKVLETN
jgi:chemotaxis protein MotB